jgi:hypothetical protein
MTIRMTMAIIVTVIFCNSPAYPSFPQLFWPQKDMDSFSVNQPTLANRVLVVSRASVFKLDLAGRIRDAFKSEPVYVKGIGLKSLKNEDVSGYAAIVIINTCMAWDWDRNIHAFFKGKQSAKNVIVLTTSGKGTWLPKKKPDGVDAIASASEKAGAVAASIVEKIRLLLAAR